MRSRSFTLYRCTRMLLHRVHDRAGRRQRAPARLTQVSGFAGMPVRGCLAVFSTLQSGRRWRRTRACNRTKSYRCE